MAVAVDAAAVAPPGAPDGDRPAGALTAVSLVIAAAFLAPLAYLLIRAAGVESVSDTLAGGGLWTPLRSTLTLAVAVSAASAVVGTGLAWLTTRTDLPLRRFWAVAAALPLVYPSFIGAAALVAAVAPGGLLDEVVPGLSSDHLPTIDGLGGSFLVLTLFTYPYVYLPVAARVGSLPPSYEESARLLGHSGWRVFRGVVLPQIAGAIWAGTLLVFLYVVSDFGAVAQMRYRTLSVEIFESQVFDRDRSLVLGAVLGLVAVAVVAVERGVNRRRARVEVARAKRALHVPLGRWKWPAEFLVAFLITNALLGPLSVLGYWAVRGFTGSRGLGSTDLADLAEPTITTAGLAVAAAVVAIAAVLPVAYLTARHRSRVGGVVNAAVVGGFALPGLIVALSLVFWTLSGPSWTSSLYQTVPLLLVAYVVHFGAQAMRSSQVAVAGVPRRLDDAARSLGATRSRRFRSIELPLMLPGLLAGGGLVLLSVMKELPATLLLRPTSIDTLAVRVWRAREAARWSETGLASLALVGLSAILTWFLVVRRAERF
jgi:iron(III) transport system permease protein